MDTTTKDRHAVLSQLVKDRMHDLGHTLETLCEATQALDASRRGLSMRTVSHMRAGTGDSYHPRSQRLMERALEWAEGTVQAVLDGEQDTAVTAENADPLTVTQLAREVVDLRERLDALVEALSGVRRL